MASFQSVVILGGGPAGCQCALWLKMLGIDVMIIEEKSVLGGSQAESPYDNNWLIGNFNLPAKKLAANIAQHIKSMDIPVIYERTVERLSPQETGFSISLQDQTIDCMRLVIATGAKPRQANFIENETLLIGPSKKIFNFPFQNKRVAILGGGDNAAENYAFVAAKKPGVTHLYSRTIVARKNLWQAVNEDDVFLFPYTVDQHTRRIQHQGEVREYDVILVLYGFEANVPHCFDAMRMQLMNSQGYINVDASCHTAVPNLYAIGEITNRMHPSVATAMADGVVCAKAIQYELEKKG